MRSQGVEHAGLNTLLVAICLASSTSCSGPALAKALGDDLPNGVPLRGHGHRLMERSRPGPIYSHTIASMCSASIQNSSHLSTHSAKSRPDSLLPKGRLKGRACRKTEKGSVIAEGLARFLPSQRRLSNSSLLLDSASSAAWASCVWRKPLGF